MPTSSPDFQQFMKRRADIALAYVNGDAAPLHEILAAHAPATFFGPGGGQVSGGAAVSKADREGAGHFVPGGGGSRLAVLHAREGGDLAYWVGIQHAHVRMEGHAHPVPMDLRVSRDLPA